jgi:hypothetical protein
MKHILIVLFLAASAWAEELPPAPQILAAARAQLPSQPVHMSGTLKRWTANGHMKKKLSIEMRLDWGAAPPQASYQIRDEKNGEAQTLDIRWLPAGPEFQYSKNGERVDAVDLNSEIEGLNTTWADLSFSFLWDPNAETLGLEKKFGKKRYEISVPRPNDGTLLLWIEKETGRLVKAEENDADNQRIKTIRVVSVKEFDDLWMVKDLDIIHPDGEGKTSLRIDTVETVE